jgi:hypothetical protein
MQMDALVFCVQLNTIANFLPFRGHALAAADSCLVVCYMAWLPACQLQLLMSLQPGAMLEWRVRGLLDDVWHLLA